jgi:predicted nucleic acid-binding protein
VVGPPTVEAFLKKHRALALDTSAFIYFVEQHPRYFPLCEKLFAGIETGRFTACTSTLTLLEVLVQPYRLQKDDIVLKFYALLTSYPNLTWVPVGLNVADKAAQIRAGYRLKTPDAIQAASAIVAGATGFICNDKAYQQVEEFECLIIDEYAPRRSLGL